MLAEAGACGNLGAICLDVVVFGRDLRFMAGPYMMRARWPIWLAVWGALAATATFAQTGGAQTGGAQTGGVQAPPADQNDAHLAEMLATERALTHVAPADTTPDCPVRDDFQSENAIIVCRHHTDTRRYRVPSSIDENPNSAAALNNGIVHAPNVDGTPPCLAFCVRQRFGHVPPPVYYLDTTTLPEPADGTDAWKIAHGQMAAH